MSEESIDGRLSRVLGESDVKVKAKGNKDFRIPKALAEDPELRTRLLTKHGAKIVLEATRSGERLSYKAIGALLYAEAQTMVGEERTRAQKEIDFWRQKAIESAKRVAQIEGPANGDSHEGSEDTAGN